MGYYDNATDYIDERSVGLRPRRWQRYHAAVPPLPPGPDPFVRATYGNDVRMYPDAGATYQVFVATSGYWTARQ